MLRLGTLLIVDSDSNRRAVLVTLLQPHFTVEALPSLPDAWEWLTRQVRLATAPLVLLLDCSLPHWEEAVRALRADERFAATVIFCLSRLTFARDQRVALTEKQTAMQAGADCIAVFPPPEEKAQGASSLDLVEALTSTVRVAKQAAGNGDEAQRSRQIALAAQLDQVEVAVFAHALASTANTARAASIADATPTKECVSSATPPTLLPSSTPPAAAARPIPPCAWVARTALDAHSQWATALWPQSVRLPTICAADPDDTNRQAAPNWCPHTGI
jgi:CheY-like chemotaxis protein